ncbi:MAG TPA: hypothetical protein PKJ84_15915 [Anaerolineales bacterium]|nr:hypothetical protein [Anaerolineales bacterium]
MLYDICTEWGYCLSPADTKRIAESREITAEEFALAVLKAENMEVEPELVNKIVGFFITKIGSERLYSNG